MWLGIRARVLDICGDSTPSQIVSKIQAFKIGSLNQIMVASYGYFRKYAERLAECTVDLIICDEVFFSLSFPFFICVVEV